MRYADMDAIFTANAEIRERFLHLLSGVSDHEADIAPDGEKWSIKQVVEHVAMVDQGVVRICGKLISEAKEVGKMSNGTISISAEFQSAVETLGKEKLEAPTQVQPKGETAIPAALQQLKDNENALESMRDDLNTYDLAEPKFPHPYFGGLTAVEWLILAGGHKMRHARQIEDLLSKIRQ